MSEVQNLVDEWAMKINNVPLIHMAENSYLTGFGKQDTMVKPLKVERMVLDTLI